jgi:hypothetical protein
VFEFKLSVAGIQSTSATSNCCVEVEIHPVIGKLKFGTKDPPATLRWQVRPVGTSNWTMQSPSSIVQLQVPRTGPQRYQILVTNAVDSDVDQVEISARKGHIPWWNPQ